MLVSTEGPPSGGPKDGPPEGGPYVLRAAGEAEREAEAEDRRFARTDQGAGDRPEIGLPNEAAERRQRGLRRGRRLSDDVNRPARERVPSERQHEAGRGA